jgi:hypothetical protein
VSSRDDSEDDEILVEKVEGVGEGVGGVRDTDIQQKEYAVGGNKQARGRLRIGTHLGPNAVVEEVVKAKRVTKFQAFGNR